MYMLSVPHRHRHWHGPGNLRGQHERQPGGQRPDAGRGFQRLGAVHRAHCAGSHRGQHTLRLPLVLQAGLQMSCDATAGMQTAVKPERPHLTESGLPQQLRVTRFNGQSPVLLQSTPYDLSFLPSSNALAAASADGASAADVAAANLDVVIQPCIVGALASLNAIMPYIPERQTSQSMSLIPAYTSAFRAPNTCSR